MREGMDFLNHATKLGKLVANLQALEIIIRTFLFKHSGATEDQIIDDTVDVGDKIPENFITNYDSLGSLIVKYNEILQTCDSNLCVDKTLVADVRDIIAHGRVISSSPQPPMTLYKFGRPSHNSVSVTHKEVLDFGWYQTKINYIRGEMKKVTKASSLFGYSFPS